MKARFDTVYYANNASVADPAMLLPPAYCNATMVASVGGSSGRGVPGAAALALH